MIAFWLMPAAGEREFFRSIVRQLATAHDAPVFEPHVTLAAGDFEEQRALASLEEISVRAIRLRVHAIHFSDAFTKTVFVQFQPCSLAADLSATIAQAVGSRGGYHFDPHLSLIYKAMPEEQKKSIAAGIQLPFTEVSFDSVRVITGPAHTSSRADVEAWRTLAEKPLGPTRP
jgi:2'-5' RNA ligase